MKWVLLYFTVGNTFFIKWGEISMHLKAFRTHLQDRIINPWKVYKYAAPGMWGFCALAPTFVLQTGERKQLSRSHPKEPAAEQMQPEWWFRLLKAPGYCTRFQASYNQRVVLKINQIIQDGNKTKQNKFICLNLGRKPWNKTGLIKVCVRRTHGNSTSVLSSFTNSSEQFISCLAPCYPAEQTS